MDIKTLRQTDEDVVILPGARVSGDVTMGHGCSIWYNAVLRGDASPIVLGKNTNIQDNATVHGSHDAPTTVGNGVIVGHNAILHGCTVGDNTLIGMGSIVLDNAVIGQNCIVGAGALVTKNTVIPDGSMVLGSPAKVVRPLTPEEIQGIRTYCQSYLEKKELYR
jgi:carbonic anhydrase/acetyltransferase-like protein (isoleucine patch superfamily)